MDRAFENSARVAFIGDSITANGAFIAKMYEYYLKNCPDKKVKMYNCGVPGDNSGAALKRLEEDVARYDPTEVVIMFGMNDIGRHLYTTKEPDAANLADRERRKEFCISNTEKIAAYYHAKGVPITICSVTPCDEITQNETPQFYGICEAFDDMYKRVIERTKNLDIKLNVNLITPMTRLLTECEGNSFINPDRVHPNNVGHEIMARIFLKAQGFDVDIPTPENILSPESFLTGYSETNMKRMSAENKLRTLMFIEWNVQFGRETMTEKQKVEFWKGYAEEFSKISDYHKSCAYNYIENKLNENTYLSEILELTDELSK